MRIAINAQLLSFSQNYRNGGISRYIRYLLTELAAHSGQHEYIVFVNGQDVVERLEASSPQITYIPLSWPEERPVARVAWEQFALPRILRQRHIDVFHSPANVLPEMLPQSCAGVVTLHDMAFLRYPKVLTRSKRIYHRTFTTRSLHRATMIIAVSESTKHDVHEMMKIPAQYIRTVYPCIDSRFLSVISEEALDAFRQKQGLPQKFLLYLGTLEPRKNLPKLLEAYADLRKTFSCQEKLVLAGAKGWYYDEIFEKVRELGLESEIIFPGYVSDADQPLWYRAASVFVFPSLYEGFGIPVAEALAAGTPVVTSNVSSLPEVGAGIALTISPDDVEGMAGAMHKALTDEAYRQLCRSSASTVAQRFSAQAMVEQTISVYEQAATYKSVGSRSQRVSLTH